MLIFLNYITSLCSFKKLYIFPSEWVDGYDDAVEWWTVCSKNELLWWVDMRISGILSTYVNIYTMEFDEAGRQKILEKITAKKYLKK